MGTVPVFRVRYAGLILAATLLAGCSAKPVVRQNIFNVDASQRHHAYVRVEADDKVRAPYGYDVTQKALTKAFADHASHRGQGRFSPTSGRQADAIGKELAERLAKAADR
jgi:hypothetical protein